MPTLTRRSLIKGSVATVAFAMTQRPLAVFGFDSPAAGEEPVKFLPDQMIPKDRTMLRWDELTSWITPNDQIFNVAHYGYPEVDPAAWNLTVSGWVKKPLVLTLECSEQRLQPRTEDEEKVWVLRPRPAHARDWVGCLAAASSDVTDHSMEAIRTSIAARRKGGA
jgi:hypothetical protein